MRAWIVPLTVTVVALGCAPTDLETGTRSIATGELHSCHVSAEGDALCWGANGFGVLGVGDEVDRTRATVVGGGQKFRSLSASGLHVCAIARDGKAWCWGSNSAGQGGTGAVEGPHLVPKAVSGGLTFTEISVGSDHTCALTATGKAYCWGANGSGQLGTGTAATQELAPAEVAGGLAFQTLSAGASFTCGVTTDSKGYCWGLDSSGELGDGGPITHQSTSFSRVPVAVAGNLELRSITAGQFFACAVTTGGAGHCWGFNDVGRLGNGTDEQSAPIPVVGGINFTAISAGATHACGVDSEGRGWCWGANNEGELGTSSPSDLSRAPVQVSGGLAFSEIAAGRNAGSAHSCAISADRKQTYCWGRNDRGQLGTGATSTNRVDTPQPVVGP